MKRQLAQNAGLVLVFQVQVTILARSPLQHRGQDSKQINIAKCVSKFLICGAKMLDKCVKSKKRFIHCPFLQSQAK